MAGLLEHVPGSIVDKVRLIDLADEQGAPGINLLDTRIFADRDRTADSVVRVARGLWEQWGPRMQSILEHTVKTLHEANAHPSTDAGDQHTILDGLKLLSDGKFRGEVLAKVSDPYIMEWWERDFGSWHRQYRAEALAPVQTRLAYYASSKRARSILGQSRSTIDLRETILDGGVLLVSTAQGTAGRDVAALVGASLLNLVDSVIREQESLPLNRRRGALVVVDEMQSMPGVDYESMLSELGKYGASFILATQSLAKLDDLSRTMQDTILANLGCLAVFQVAGNDARRLVWELGKDRVSEDDITSLPVHQCYVRATVGTERLPAYSMMTRKPEPGDPEVAEAVRNASRGYTTSAGQLAAANADGVAEGERIPQAPGGAAERQRCAAAPDPGPWPDRRAAPGAHPQPQLTWRLPIRRGFLMSAGGLHLETLRRLATMPFLDRLELAAVSGVPDRSAYNAVAALEREGLVASLPHATALLRRTRRYFPTDAGLRRLAGVEGISLEQLLRRHPVSARWRRILLERLDAVAVIYRVAVALSDAAHPSGSGGTGPGRRTRESSCPADAAWPWCARATPPTGPPSPSGCGGCPRRRGPAPCCCWFPTTCGCARQAGPWTPCPCWASWRAKGMRPAAMPVPRYGARPPPPSRCACGKSWTTCVPVGNCLPGRRPAANPFPQTWTWTPPETMLPPACCPLC